MTQYDPYGPLPVQPPGLTPDQYAQIDQQMRGTALLIFGGAAFVGYQLGGLVGAGLAVGGVYLFAYQMGKDL